MNSIVNDLLVQYVDEGKGPVIVFLHGWGSNMKAFDGLSDALKNKYRVIRLDLPGFGGTQKPSSDWYVKDYAVFVQSFLAKLNIAEVYAFGGHSFGGRVIIKGVADGVFAPKRIILMGSAGIKPQKTIKQSVVKVVAKVGKAVLSLPVLSRLASPLRERLYQASGTSDYLNSGAMQQIFLNTINEDLSDDASKNTIPTQLIWGENDEETPVRDGQKLDGLMKKSRLTVIPDAGHYVFLDQPERTITLIKECLDD